MKNKFFTLQVCACALLAQTLHYAHAAQKRGKSMKEQDMIHKLTEEEIEVPESIRPENIYKQLLKVDEEREESFLPQKKRKQRGGYIMRKKAVSIVIAVEAGLLICLLAAGQRPVSLNSNYSVAWEEADEPLITEQGPEEAGLNGHYGKEDVSIEDYQSVFRRLQSIAEQREKARKKLLQEIQKQNDKGIWYEYENVDMMTNEIATAEDSSSGTGSAATSDTNVRTQGVDEGDIVKTDGDYIYTYRAEEKSHCYIYSADQGKTQKVATISLEQKKFYDNIEDMYLSEGKLVLVVTRSINSRQKKAIRELYQKAGGDYQNFCKESWPMVGYAWGCVVGESDDVLRTENPTVNYSRTLIYDISDPTSPVLEQELFQDGIYESSRIVDGKLYLMSRRYVNIAHIDSDKENTFVPQIGGECVSPDKVDMASKNEEECYQVLSSVDVASGEYVDKKAVLGGGSQIYVSAKSIYLVDQLSWGGKQTVVMRYSYQDGKMKKEAEGKIEGYLKDDYSLDEQDDYLRLVTTYYNKKGIEKNAVYILNDQLKKTGEIKNIAPKESVYAVRFMGDLVYFVTFEQTDPVFVADLSNPSAPEIIGELKLPGFSSYLHPIGDDLMVGIGYINDEHERGVKLSLFDVSDPVNIKEIHKTVLGEYGICEVMHNPNALFVDAQRSLLGFSAADWNGRRFDYLVYQVDREKGFVRKCKEDIRTKDDYYERDGARGLYIDDYFYIVKPGRKIKSCTYPGFKKLS